MAEGARSFARALKADPEKPGATTEKRRIRKEFAKWSRGLPDITLSPVRTSDKAAVESQPVDNLSDVEPDDNPVSCLPTPQLTALPPRKSPVREPEPGVIVIDSDERGEAKQDVPYHMLFEDISPPDSV